MEDDSLRSQNVQTYGNVYHDTGPTLKNLFFFLKIIYMVTQLPACCGEDNLSNGLEKGLEKYQTGNSCLCIFSKVCSCLCTWVTSNSEQNIDPMWKKFMKHVELVKLTSFRDHVYLGCIQRECEPNANTFDEDRKCSNLESLQEQLTSYLNRRKW